MYSQLKFLSIYNNICPIYGVLDNSNSPHLIAVTTKSNRPFTEIAKTEVLCHSGVAQKQNALFCVETVTLWLFASQNKTKTYRDKITITS